MSVPLDLHAGRGRTRRRPATNAATASPTGASAAFPNWRQACVPETGMRNGGSPGRSKPISRAHSRDVAHDLAAHAMHPVATMETGPAEDCVGGRGRHAQVPGDAVAAPAVLLAQAEPPRPGSSRPRPRARGRGATTGSVVRQGGTLSLLSPSPVQSRNRNSEVLPVKQRLWELHPGGLDEQRGVPVEEFGGFAVGMAAAYMTARLSA